MERQFLPWSVVQKDSQELRFHANGSLFQGIDGGDGCHSLSRFLAKALLSNGILSSIARLHIGHYFSCVERMVCVIMRLIFVQVKFLIVDTAPHH
mmetsp:Transcript_24720/g.66058  ORF Transcript_24720/g.66058 Transcript_24720/m.66058 type:complete len:95 (-) Transcript_24720:31-315(-)